MNVDDFMELSKGQVGKTCTVSVCGENYMGVFTGITLNVDFELCMSIKMDSKTCDRFKNVATYEGELVTEIVSIRLSAINGLEFESLT